jgi:hypothetical protein
MKYTHRIKLFIFSGLIVVALSGCGPPVKDAVSGIPEETITGRSANSSRPLPSIELTPVEKSESGYLLLLSETLKVDVVAPEAERADIFYRPVTSSDRAVKLKTISAADGGRFESEIRAPEDFNGELWARIRYPDGHFVETERLRLAVRTKADAKSKRPGNSNTNTDASPARTVDDNESARSDKKTGGRIESAALKTGSGDVRLTVNVPAFTLTLWQGPKEIKTYYVGVGRKNYPIPIGLRAADEIILNPDWIPPDSEWVRAADIEPYERIPASSPDNPLGKIKIPLGDAYLLHEAQGTSDIGNLVSHGCVRVLRADIFELTKMIAAAQNLEITGKEIESYGKKHERRVIAIDEIPVDINYDTMVVEGGVLSIYPDVYEQKTNTVEELRAELESYQIDVSKLSESTLKRMLEKVNDNRKFVVSLGDIRTGNALEKGSTRPLTPYQAKKAN